MGRSARRDLERVRGGTASGARSERGKNEVRQAVTGGVRISGATTTSSAQRKAQAGGEDEDVNEQGVGRRGWLREAKGLMTDGIQSCGRREVVKESSITEARCGMRVFGDRW